MTSHRRNRIVDHRIVKGRDLLPNPANWRTHPPQQRAATTAALDLLGYVDELKVVEIPDGLLLLDGHLRADIGADDDIPIAVVDLDPDEQRIFLATYDPLAAMAITDHTAYDALADVIVTEDDVLIRLLAGVREYDAPLFLAGQRREQDAELTSGATKRVEADDYVAKTAAGQLWALGEHRLLCGDATKADDVERLMGDERASLVLTDPPYLMDYAGGSHPQSWSNRDQVREKQWDSYQEQPAATGFYIAWIEAAQEKAAMDRAGWYQWYASLRAPEVHDAWRATKLLTHAVIVWVKSRPVLTHSRYMWQHESCAYGWREGKTPKVRPPANAKTVWQIGQAGDERFDHPTQKPVALMEEAIGHQSRAGHLIYDPFVGSGTTIIAADNLGRKCYGLEIQPRYCDLIIQRWEAYTGAKAELLE